MSDADVIQWRRRRTARWLSLSLAARGAIEGIVAALNDRGELQLPKMGLPSLAALLGRPWTEVEPAVLEALDSGKLRFDRDRMMIVDPSHEPKPSTDREESAELDLLHVQVAAARAELLDVQTQTRTLSQSPEAIRSRQRRATKASPKSADGRQLGLFRSNDRSNDRSRPVATGPTDESQVISSWSLPVDRPVATVASLSDLKIIKDQRGTPVDLGHATGMPTGWIEQANELRPDFTSEIVADVWDTFRTIKSRSYPSWTVVNGEWKKWLRREDRSKTTSNAPRPSLAKPPPYHRPFTLARPDEEPDVPVPRRPPKFHYDDYYRAQAQRLASAVGMSP